MSCPHENFLANVNVNRLTDKDGGPVNSYNCELTVVCADCGLNFRFICPDYGMLPDRPSISPDGQELRVYCEPSDGSLTINKRMGFKIRPPDDRSQIN